MSSKHETSSSPETVVHIQGGMPADHKTSASLLELLAAAKDRLAAMSEEERQAMWAAQRDSWVRGEMQLDRITSPTPSDLHNVNAGYLAKLGSYLDPSPATIDRLSYPEGWQLVPIHATEAMEKAAVEHVAPYHDENWRRVMPNDLFRLGWKAMLSSAPTHQPSPPPSNHVELPQDVVNLVIAAREFWDDNNDLSPESLALDKALEAFSSRIPYENEPEADHG
jgi:hypothetical protein